MCEEAGIDPDYSTKSGLTCLMSSIWDSKEEIALYLLKHRKVDSTKKKRDGMSSYHLSASRGLLSIVKFLIEEAKVDPHETLNDGRTAL